MQRWGQIWISIAGSSATSHLAFLFFNNHPHHHHYRHQHTRTISLLFARSLQTSTMVCCCRRRQARRATHLRSVNRLSLMRDTERPRGQRPDSVSLLHTHKDTHTRMYSVICECKEEYRSYTFWGRGDYNTAQLCTFICCLKWYAKQWRRKVNVRF